MITALCIIIFIALSAWEIKLLYADRVQMRLPYGSRQLVELTGNEALIIVMFATAYIGLSPVLSLRLGFLELLCVIGIIRHHNKVIISPPIILFCIFLIWEIIGIAYTPDKGFGIRMILKYIYPLLFALFTAQVVRNGEIFITAGLWARRVATIGIVIMLLPGLKIIAGIAYWFNAALVTSMISLVIFSFALVEFSDEKRKNLWWGIALCLPCFIFVYRTDIFGTAIALSAFFLVKYRLKALPIIAIIGLLGLCSMFYIPAVKNKMFINPEKVTITDYMTGNIDEDNIQTNMRKFAWEDVTQKFYDGHEIIGSGTGRVQTFYYSEVMDSRRGGQLHNDFLVLKCDNGLIGLILFIIAYLSITLHCIHIYHKSSHPYTRMAALVAGASLMGVFVTMYSDNTLSYSMVTQSFSWGCYGMALSFKQHLE